MTLEDVSQEPFPAVSICIPNSLKWPGIIKATQKMQPNLINSMPNDLLDKWYWTIWEIKDERMGLTIAATIEKLFPLQDFKRDFVLWLLNAIYLIRNDDDKLAMLKQNYTSCEYKLSYVVYVFDYGNFSFLNPMFSFLLYNFGSSEILPHELGILKINVKQVKHIYLSNFQLKMLSLSLGPVRVGWRALRVTYFSCFKLHIY